MLETMSLASCFVYLLEGEGPEMVARAVFNRDPVLQEQFRAYASERPLRIDQGRSEEIFKTGKPVMVSQVAEDPIVPEDIRARLGGGSLLILPLRAHGKFLGAMYLLRGGRGPALDEDILPLATHVANQVSAAIATARLYDALESKVSERTAHLQNVYEQLAQRFSSGRDFFIELSGTLKADLAAIDAAAPSPEVRVAVDRLAGHLGELFARLDSSPDL
jgi:GAF domain-containing protein